MKPGAYADPHTPSARGWSQRELGRWSGMHSSWIGKIASGKPQHVSRSVAILLRQALAGAMLIATHRGGFPLPFVPGSDACSWQAGHRLRGSLSGERSTAVSLSLRKKTLPLLTRLPMLRLTDAVIRPPWLPQRTLPRAGSPLVRPAGFTRRPTGGVGTGTFSPLLPGKMRQGRPCRIRSVIWVSISLRLTHPHVFLHQADSAVISQMTALISPVSVRCGGWL
jgi:hypothetical protein